MSELSFCVDFAEELREEVFWLLRLWQAHCVAILFRSGASSSPAVHGSKPGLPDEPDVEWTLKLASQLLKRLMAEVRTANVMKGNRVGHHVTS